MKKRIFSLKLTVWIGITMAVVLASTVTMRNGWAAEIKLRFALTTAPGDSSHDASVVLADRVAKVTNGRVKLIIFPKGQLGNQRELFTQLRTGAIDMTCTNYPILSDVVPEFLTLNGGFFFKDWSQVRALLESPDFGQLWHKQLVEKAGVRVLASFYYGARMLTVNKPILNKADMKGLKIRAVPNAISIAIIKGMGGSPTPVAFPELFQALRQGIVDGQENPIPTIYSQKFWEVQKYIVLTSHQINAMPFVINEKAYQRIPTADREILSKLAIEAAEWGTDHTIKKTNSFLLELKAKGMTVIQPSAEVLAEWKQSVLSEIASTVDGKEWPIGLMDKVIAFSK